MADNEHSSERRERFTPSKISRLHRRQLFHWIGSDLRTRGKLTNSDRETYVKYLCNSLGQGLWLKVPRKPDALLDGDHFKVTQPVCCFTETSLDEVDDHSRKYGRLGLGFPGRFVLERGGRPVNYLQDKKNDSSVQSWVRLAETFRKPEVLAVRRQLASRFSDN